MSDFSSLLWIWVSNVKDKKSAYVPRSSVGFRASQAFHSCLYPLLEYQTWNLYRLLMCSNFSISGRDISTWDQTWMSKQNTHTVLNTHTESRVRARETKRSKSKYLSTRNNHFWVWLPLSNRWLWCEIALELARKSALPIWLRKPVHVQD